MAPAFLVVRDDSEYANLRVKLGLPIRLFKAG